jgi:seryl-tRNA synthetase
MLDIKFVRENPEVVKENIRKKFQDHKIALVDEVIELDQKRRDVQKEADDLRANRNKISKEIDFEIFDDNYVILYTFGN